MRAEATCGGLVLAKVRSWAFIRNAVGEARGFKVGFRLVSEDGRRQERQKGAVPGSALLSGLQAGRTREESQRREPAADTCHRCAPLEGNVLNGDFYGDSR